MDLLHSIHGVLQHVQATTSTVSSDTLKEQLKNAAIPQSAVTDHYGSKGKTIGAKSHTDYSRVIWDKTSGKISGGTLKVASSTPEEFGLSATSLGFQSNGLPGTSQTNIYNQYLNSRGEIIKKPGVFKKVSLDLSKASWSQRNTIHTGNLAISTVDGATGVKLHDGNLEFNESKLVAASFQHYSPEGNGEIQGYTKVDYTKVQTLGSSFEGGSYDVQRLDINKAITSTTTVSLSSAGIPARLHTEHYKDGNTSKPVKLTTMIMGSAEKPLNYNARNEIEDGVVGVVVTDGDNNLLSKTDINYKKRVISSLTTKTYKDQKHHSNTNIDYSSANFNNDLRVVDSSTVVSTTNLEGKLISQTVMNYDSFGNLTKSTSELFNDEGKLQYKTTVDNKDVIFGYKHKPRKGTSVITTTSADNLATTTDKVYNDLRSSKERLPVNKEITKIAMAQPIVPDHDGQGSAAKSTTSFLTTDDGKTFPASQKKYRSDGTLAEIIKTTFDKTGKVPEFLKITQYAKNGKSVIKSYVVDLTNFSPNSLTQTGAGTIGVISYHGGRVKESATTLNFS